MFRNLIVKLLGLKTFKVEVCEIVKVAVQLLNTRIQVLETALKTQGEMNKTLIACDQRLLDALEIITNEWDDMKDDLTELKQMKHLQ